MVLVAPKAASIWGLVCKASGDFSSWIPQVGSNPSLGIPLCPVGQTHSILHLAAPPWTLGTYVAKLLSHEFQKRIS